MADNHLDWKPRTPSHVRLAGNPLDWSAYSVGDEVGVFMGNCWRKGSIHELLRDSALITTRRLGSVQTSIVLVHDARNVCPVRDLTRPARDHSSPLFDGGDE